MEIFNKNGCLTKQAIQNIIIGEHTELERLEISEHLAFCDTCLTRYTNKLCQIDDEDYLTPSQDLTPSIMKRIKQRAVKIFYNRYVTVAAACGFAIILVFTGVFGSFHQTYTYEIPVEKQPSEFAEKIGEFATNTTDMLQNFFSLSFLKGENNNETK